MNYLDQLFEPIVAIDKKRKLLYHNHFFSTFAKAPPRVLKKIDDLSDFITSNDIDIKKFLNNAIKSKDVSLSEEVAIQFKDQNESYFVVIKSIPIENDQHLICFHDMSIERRLYDKYRQQMDEIKETHIQIIQADKLATLGELTAGISHEISNPLTIASGNCDILEVCLEEKDLNPQKALLKKALNDVKDSHRRINSIITNMKSYLHKSEEQKEYSRLEDIINHAIELVTPSFREAKVDIKTKFEQEDIIALVNPIKIEQVLVNLLRNSLQAITEEQKDNGKVTINLSKDFEENNLVIEVCDNGPGIPKEIQEKVFETFFTTKKVGDGTGLGLPISLKIIEAHNGELRIDPSYKKGAKFILTLPMLEISSYAQNEVLMNTMDMDDESDYHEGKRVLVIDNEVQILNVLSKFFQDEGLVFIGSANPEDALKIINDIHIDIIITDYNMPQMNGGEFAKKAREEGLTCPILYLTSKSFAEQYKKDKDKYDITGLILKPFKKEEVLKTIHLALEHQEENE